MTYADSEQSVHFGKVNELYRFVGTYGNYYYTTGPEPVPFQAADEEAPNTYLPLTMRRSEIQIGTMDDDGNDLTIEMPVTTELVALYGFKVAPPELYLTMFRYHRGDENYAIYWQGDINNITAARGFATLKSASLLAQAAADEFPNVFYQRPCNHALFDFRCKVIEADFSVAGTVTAVADRVITVSDLGALGGMLVGGELKLASGERRMIVAEAGAAITVNFPFAQCAPADTYTMVVGCNHAWEGDCATRFANQLNFGGFRHIPPENPFSGGIDPPQDPIADDTCLPPHPEPFAGWWLKFRVDFWPVGVPCGPTAFPNTFLDIDTDGDSAVDTSIDAAHPGDGSPGNLVQLEFISSGEHDIQAIEYTLWQADGFTDFPSDITLVPRLYNLRLQFPASGVCGNNSDTAGGRARVTIKRWSESSYSLMPPTGGNTVPLVDGAFEIQGLWPRDYSFFF